MACCTPVEQDRAPIFCFHVNMAVCIPFLNFRAFAQGIAGLKGVPGALCHETLLAALLALAGPLDAVASGANACSILGVGAQARRRSPSASDISSGGGGGGGGGRACRSVNPLALTDRGARSHCCVDVSHCMERGVLTPPPSPAPPSAGAVLQGGVWPAAAGCAGSGARRRGGRRSRRRRWARPRTSPSRWWQHRWQRRRWGRRRGRRVLQRATHRSPAR
jgi:hypothetical protein